jgi:hypothetical protein
MQCPFYCPGVPGITTPPQVTYRAALHSLSIYVYMALITHCLESTASLWRIRGDRQVTCIRLLPIPNSEQCENARHILLLSDLFLFTFSFTDPYNSTLRNFRNWLNAIKIRITKGGRSRNGWQLPSGGPRGWGLNPDGDTELFSTL